MTFQSLASMGLPALTIHTVVANSGFLFKNMPDCMARRYGPVALGLSIVPFLPYIFDKPVEDAIEWATEKGEDIFRERKNKPKE
ncbi:unnamed protein product [Nesidiocoris tenuis]|uniref:Mitochondrial fission process protein 1 n=1 Tax=Nesidiocoris tenuis TaxID=355587 RepID=A0A6H5FXH6_9HEMI|nr:unnamed protein product [Nesidiocoris tenuis]